MPTVTKICHDSPTRDSCPALYRTDEGEYYVQGYTETDQAILAQLEIPDGEAVVKITARLLNMIADACPATAPAVTQAPGLLTQAGVPSA